MKIIERLKKVFKAAVKDGKIYYIGRHKEIYNSDKIPCVRVLDQEQWKQLERDEVCLRTNISSKEYNYGDFVCKGNFKKWINVF